jgi:hypothetical protein
MYRTYSDRALMTRKCPRCSTRNHDAAMFCARCGLALDAEESATADGKRALCHPDPIRAPAGFRPVEGGPDLYCRWEAAWGGAMLLGTETIAVFLFNGGYSLEDVVLEIRGLDPQRRKVFTKEYTLAALPRGSQATVEIPSYEVSAPASDLAVALVSGRIASAG